MFERVSLVFDRPDLLLRACQTPGDTDDSMDDAAERSTTTGPSTGNFNSHATGVIPTIAWYEYSTKMSQSSDVRQFGHKSFEQGCYMPRVGLSLDLGCKPLASVWWVELLGLLWSNSQLAADTSSSAVR